MALIQSPEIVADELFARGSIDSGIKEKVHLHTHTTSENYEILFHAIGQKFFVDPSQFYVLILRVLNYTQNYMFYNYTI